MLASLGLTIMLYAAAVAVLCTILSAAARARPAFVNASLVILQIAAIGQALLDGAALLRGDHRAERATNIGYALTTLAVLPVTASVIRMDKNRWGNAAFAVACALLAVLTLRLHQTLGPVRG